MARLEGTTFLITGGGSGMGLATDRSLLHEGAAVAIAGRDEAKLQSAADSLAAAARLRAHPCDVTDKDQVRRLVEAVTQEFGRIDILVKNAGANVKNRAVQDLDPATWDHLVPENPDRGSY